MGALPGEQHVAIFPDLVLPLLRAHQRLGIDVLEPDEDGVAAGPRRLLDEARDAVAERVDLQQEPDPEALLLAQLDQPVEDRLPVAVAGEIVVGDEEAGDPLRGVGAHDRLDVVGRAVAGLAALDVDDGAEAALIGAAAAGVEARVMSGDLGHHRARQHGDRGRGHVGHVVEKIVERLRRPGVDVSQEVRRGGLRPRRRTGSCRAPALPSAPAAVPAAWRCSRRRGSRRPRPSRPWARNWRPRSSARGNWLVWTPTSATNPPPAALMRRAIAGDVDDRVALVEDFDLDFDVGAERLLLGALGEQAVDAGQAVGRDGRAPPLDDVAVVVVVRRLDQHDRKLALRHGRPRPRPSRGAIGRKTANRRRHFALLGGWTQPGSARTPWLVPRAANADAQHPVLRDEVWIALPPPCILSPIIA